MALQWNPVRPPPHRTRQRRELRVGKTALRQPPEKKRGRILRKRKRGSPVRRRTNPRKPEEAQTRRGRKEENLRSRRERARKLSLPRRENRRRRPDKMGLGQRRHQLRQKAKLKGQAKGQIEIRSPSPAEKRKTLHNKQPPARWLKAVECHREAFLRRKPRLRPRLKSRGPPRVRWGDLL